MRVRVYFVQMEAIKMSHKYEQLNDGITLFYNYVFYCHYRVKLYEIMHFFNHFALNNQLVLQESTWPP